MLISEQLREDNANLVPILFSNIDHINKLYLQALAESFKHEESGDESFAIMCTIIAVCLLEDFDNVPQPLEMDYSAEDEELISHIGDLLCHLLSLESLHKKGILKRRVVNGEPLYTGEKDKTTKSKKPTSRKSKK